MNTAKKKTPERGKDDDRYRAEGLKRNVLDSEGALVYDKWTYQSLLRGNLFEFILEKLDDAGIGDHVDKVIPVLYCLIIMFIGWMLHKIFFPLPLVLYIVLWYVGGSKAAFVLMMAWIMNRLTSLRREEKGLTLASYAKLVEPRRGDRFSLL